jgi:predicted transcriptional regulator
METHVNPRTQITVVLSHEQLQALDAFAAADRRTRSAAAALAIESFLARVATPLPRTLVEERPGRHAAAAGPPAAVATSRT